MRYKTIIAICNKTTKGTQKYCKRSMNFQKLLLIVLISSSQGENLGVKKLAKNIIAYFLLLDEIICNLKNSCRQWRAVEETWIWPSANCSN